MAYNPNVKNVYEKSQEPTGFANRTDSAISFDNSSRTFTIAPTSSEFEYYLSGVRHAKTAPSSVSITDTEGLWYFYFDGPTLSATQSFTPTFFITYCIIAALYWDSENNKQIYFAEERHGLAMDGSTHGYLHNTVGAAFANGFAITVASVNGDGSSNLHSQLSVENGAFYDEDIRHSVVNGSPQTLAPTAQVPIYFRSGATGNWRKKDADSFPVIHSGTAGYSGTLLPYNQWTGSTWQLTQLATNNYVLVHFFGTNDINNPIIGIQGITEYANKPQAIAGAYSELSQLSGLPFSEMIPIGTVIFQTSSSFSNTIKAITVSADGSPYIDFRDIEGLAINQVNDHGNLSGLEDQDHPASAIYTEASVFSGNLSGTDTNVQTALATIDGLSIANRDLSNLNATSINTSLLPDTDNTHSIGSPTMRWADGYFGPGSLHVVSNASETGIARDWSFEIDSDGYLEIAESGIKKLGITNDGLDIGEFKLPLTDGSPGQVLQTDGAGNVTWSSAGGEMAIGEAVTNATQGSILFAGTSGVLAQDNSKLFWKDIDDRLGIGTADPQASIDARGNVYVGYDMQVESSVQKSFSTPHSAANVPSAMWFSLFDGATSGMKILDARDGSFNSQSIELWTHHGGNNAGARLTIDKSGYATFKSGTNSTTAFQVQNESGTPVLNIDTTNQRVGIGTSTPPQLFSTVGGQVDVTRTLSAASDYTHNYALRSYATASGSSGNRTGMLSYLAPGYTGSDQTAAAEFDNQVAGGGTQPWASATGNFGAIYLSFGSTATGTNVGLLSSAQGGAVNYGAISRAVTPTANNQTMVGFAARASVDSDFSGIIPVGGYFGLGDANVTPQNPTFPAGGAALLVDNEAIAAPILIARNNGTEVFRIAESGNVGIGTSSPTGTLQVAGGTAAASTAGTPITLTAQSGGSGNTNGGSVIFAAGASAGTGTAGSITLTSGTGTGAAGSIIVKAGQNSLTAFQVQNVSGATILDVDSTNSRVGIGTTSPATALDCNGVVTANGVSVDSSDGLVISNASPVRYAALTPAPITGTVNDYNPGNATFIRLTASPSTATITSIANPSDGRMLYLVNAGSLAITLQNQSGGTSTNQIITGTGGNVSLAANAVATLIYDAVTTKWRVVSTRP